MVVEETIIAFHTTFLQISIPQPWKYNGLEGRQAFFFRVIGSSSARIEERLTDGDVIVVEVFREPLLGHGILGELDISLRYEVVVVLITCGGVLFVRGPSSPAAVRVVVVHDTKEKEGERQEEVQEDKGN